MYPKYRVLVFILLKSIKQEMTQWDLHFEKVTLWHGECHIQASTGGIWGSGSDCAEPGETSERSKKENPNLHLVWLLIMLSLTTPNNERFVSYFTALLQIVILCVVLLRLVRWTPLPILLMPLETCLEAGMIGHGGYSFGCLEGLSHSLRTQPYSYSQDPLSLP